MRNMEILPCGTPVKTKLGLIEGLITAACIRFEAVTYEISYFVDGQEKTIWMNEAEFTANVKHNTIGFKQ